MDDAPDMIVVDIGNSAIKLAIASGEKRDSLALESKLQWLHGDFDAAELDRWAPRGDAHWCIASVQRGKTESLLKWLGKFRPEHSFSELSFTDLSLKIEVDAPHRVGIDRLLTAVAANARRSPRQPAITITAGTAVTVNAIDREGHFLGGAILPGKPLLAKSLHEYTDALPHIREFGADVSPIGRNTGEAIRSGVQLGLQGAIRQIVLLFEKELGSEAEIFISGGDAASIHEALQLGTLAPDLVLEGAAIVAHTLLKDE